MESSSRRGAKYPQTEMDARQKKRRKECSHFVGSEYGDGIAGRKHYKSRSPLPAIGAAPREARSRPELPGAARSHPELPRAAQGHTRPYGATPSYPELPELPGAARSRPEPPGAAHAKTRSLSNHARCCMAVIAIWWAVLPLHACYQASQPSPAQPGPARTFDTAQRANPPETGLAVPKLFFIEADGKGWCEADAICTLVLFQRLSARQSDTRGKRVEITHSRIPANVNRL